MTASENSRAELWAVLAELSQRYPQWRIGQLVSNLADWADQRIWDAEDEELLRVARRHLSQLEKLPTDLVSI